MLTRLLNRYALARHSAYAVADAAIVAAGWLGFDLRRRRAEFVSNSIVQHLFRSRPLGPDVSAARFVELDPPHDVTVRGPTAWANLSSSRFWKVWHRVHQGYTVQACGILELRSARVHAPSGTIAAAGRFVSETISLNGFPYRWQYLDCIRTLWAPARHIDDGYLLTLQQSGNYYHWVCEVLPLAYALERDDRWGELPVYVGADLPAFVFEYLRLLGLDRHCRTLQRGVYQLDRLRVATFPGGSESPSPDYLSAIREACLDAIGPTIQPRRRLYVSRSDAAERRVVNEDELLRAVADLGFERVTLSGMSATEQIRLFQTADMVLAPHGAGNANILFAPRDCVVIELMEPSHYSWCFMAVASAVGQLYGCVGCPGRGTDLVVDPGAVRKVVDDLLRAREEARSHQARA